MFGCCLEACFFSEEAVDSMERGVRGGVFAGLGSARWRDGGEGLALHPEPPQDSRPATWALLRPEAEGFSGGKLAQCPLLGGDGTSARVEDRFRADLLPFVVLYKSCELF